jgi:hypothetical protein
MRQYVTPNHQTVTATKVLPPDSRVVTNLQKFVTFAHNKKLLKPLKKT